MNAITAIPAGRRREIRVLPGFRLSLACTVTYLSLIVLIPLSAAFLRAFDLGFDEWLRILTGPRVLASFKVSFGASLIAALLNAVFGLMVAWVLTRYEFPGRRIVDALVDLPFALPTAVAGIALTALYAPNGWIGQLLAPLGVQIAFKPAGIVVALAFIGLPFVVRTLQPVLADLDQDVELAAETLGAGRFTVFRRIVLPALLPALLAGCGLAFSRALGEYGSVIFIAGNIPMVSEIVPLQIMTRLEEYEYPAATVIAVTMLLLSFALMFVLNAVQLRLARRLGGRR